MSAENRLRIHNLWAKNRLSMTKLPKLNTHGAFLCLAQSILVSRAQPHIPEISLSTLSGTNKWPLRQPQHFRKPVIILPHLRRNSNRRIFLGFKFSIPVFCSKFSKYFFGWLDLSKDFLGIFKTIWRFAVVPAYPSQVVLRINRTKLSVLYYFIFSGDF